MNLPKLLVNKKAIIRSMFAMAATCVVSAAHAACYAPFTSVDCLGPAKTKVDGVKYFGYPLMPQMINGAPKPPPFELIPEMKNHANAVAVLYDPDKPYELESLFRSLDSNFKAVVFVNHVFIDPLGNHYSNLKVTSNLQMLKSAIDPYRNNIIYMAFDEPIWGELSKVCSVLGPWNDQCLFHDKAKRDQAANVMVPKLEQWANMIRTNWPGMGVAVTESGVVVSDSLKLPVNLDLYEAHCYTPFAKCYQQYTDNGQPKTINYVFNTIKTKVTELNRQFGGHRRLALVPEADLVYSRAVANPATPIETSKTDDEAVALLGQYHQMIAAEPMVNLVGPWLWQVTGDNQHVLFGARALPKTRATLENYGRTISKKPITAWTAPPLIQFTVTSPLKVNPAAWERPVWAWSATGATSCRSVTEPNAPSLQNLPPNGIFVGGYEMAPRRLDYTIECVGQGGVSRKTIQYEVK